MVLDELDALELPSREETSGAVSLFPLRPDAIDDDCWWIREIQGPDRADDPDPGDEDEIEIIEEEPAVEGPAADGGPPAAHPAARRASHILRLDTKLFTPEDARAIQAKIEEVKAEIARTPDKTSRRQLRQLKFALVHALDTYRQAQAAHRHDDGDDGPSAIDTVRRAGVGIAGGTLVAAGAVFVAVPVIPGWIFAYAGGALLATEFEGAREIVEQVKVPMARMLADDDTDKKPKPTTEGRGGEWEEMIGVRRESRSDLDSDFATMMKPRPDESEGDRKPTEMEAIFGDLGPVYDEGSRKVRHFLKKALKLEDVDVNGREGLGKDFDKSSLLHSVTDPFSIQKMETDFESKHEAIGRRSSNGEAS